MTFRAEHQGYIRGISGFAAATSHPTDSSALRDGLINNTNHLIDECGQTRVAITLPPGTYFEQASPSTEQFQLVDRLPVLGFPAILRTIVASPVYAVHLRASISAAGTATFRIKLGFFGDDTVSPVIGATVRNVATVTTTSTSGADLAPTAIHIPRALIDARAGEPTNPYAWMPGISSLDANGALAYGRSMWLQLEVWAKTSVVTSKPRVHGLYAREYNG